MENEEQVPDVMQLDWEKGSVEKLYSAGTGGINPERWERARTDILFEDVVAELTGEYVGQYISCPFHGPDRRPSFCIYRRTNDGWCFGCPDGQKYYDSITFASRYMNVSKPQALRWIERNWSLPSLAERQDAEDDEGGQTGDSDAFVGFWDLSESYILKARQDVQRTKDSELGEDYLRYYFEGLSMEKASEKARKSGDDEGWLRLRTEAAMSLAKILGKETLSAIAGK